MVKTNCKEQRVIAHDMIMSFISLMACWEKKLFLRLLVRAESILYPFTSCLMHRGEQIAFIKST